MVRRWLNLCWLSAQHGVIFFSTPFLPKQVAQVIEDGH